MNIYMSNEKATIIPLTVGLIKSNSYITWIVFHTPVGNKKVEIDLANYATKSDLKSATGVDTSKVARKADLKIRYW